MMLRLFLPGRTFNKKLCCIFTRSLASSWVKSVADGVKYSEDGRTIITSTECHFVPDRAYRMPLSTIMALSEQQMLTNLRKKGTEIDKANIILRENEVLPVYKAQNLKIHPGFYQTKLLNNVLSVHFGLSGVGETSLGVGSKVYNSDGVLLCEMLRILVSCDHNLKSMPIPKAALNIFKKLAMDEAGKSVIPVPFSERLGSEICYTHNIMPRPSDLDILYHVNNVNYITYMIDTAVMGAKAGVYSQLRQDIAFGNVKEIVLHYYNGLFLDDNVKVATWEDEEIPLKLCFEISSESKLACRGSILLHEPLLTLSDDVRKRFVRAHEF